MRKKDKLDSKRKSVWKKHVQVLILFLHSIYSNSIHPRISSIWYQLFHLHWQNHLTLYNDQNRLHDYNLFSIDWIFRLTKRESTNFQKQQFITTQYIHSTLTKHITALPVNEIMENHGQLYLKFLLLSSLYGLNLSKLAKSNYFTDIYNKQLNITLNQISSQIINDIKPTQIVFVTLDQSKLNTNQTLLIQGHFNKYLPTLHIDLRKMKSSGNIASLEYLKHKCKTLSL